MPEPVKPALFAEYASTPVRRRIMPWSRAPITGRLGEVLHLAAERHPSQLITVDRSCAIDPTGPLTRTYSEWAEQVDAAACWLSGLGVRPWDRVAIVKANHFDVSLLACAAARIGAVPALLSGAYGPDIAHTLLARLDRPFVVTDHEHLTGCGLDKDAVAGLTAKTVCLDGAQDRPDVIRLDEFRGDGSPATPVLRAPDEPMIITHTSGTTGVPKLVLHSAQSERGSTHIEAERWPVCGIRADDVWAYCEPYWHERHTHFMLAMAVIGQRMLMLSDPRSPNLKALLLEHRPTLVEALPNIFLYWEPMAADPDRPFGTVREFISSFDAIHTRTMRVFLNASDRRVPIWLQVWSQSENGALLLRPYLRFNVRKVGRRRQPTQLLGWPIPFFGRVRVVEPETGRRVRRGRPGLIEIAQPGRSIGYVGEQHRHDLKRNGKWWNTGDLGVINRWGALRFLDREIDRIPGHSAIELEDVLLDRLPDTTEVVILPVAGGAPVPVLSTVDNQPVDPREWAQATADMPTLAGPIHIRWEDFPRTGTWKIRRVALRERLLPEARALGTGRWT
jgi:acyl-coenzyme A synthetase/AMP-(fatty) acid ligase